MKNKAGFLNKIKEGIFQSNNYDSKIADLKKQKDDVNKIIQNYISENKAMFKKKRLSDMFTSDFFLIFASISLLFTMISLVSTVIFLKMNMLSSFLMSSDCLILSGVLFLISLPFTEKGIKSKKSKFILKLKNLYKDRREIMVLLKNIKIEKENILKMIENFDSNNNDDNERIASLPVSANFLKILPFYLSEKDIEKMMYNKVNDHLSYYDVIKFMSKLEDQNKIKKQVEQIVNMSKVEDFHCSN